jgi:hypothetical protein
MNQKEAKQLELRIQREAPQYKTSLEYVTFVGGGNWGVNVFEKSTGHSIGVMESEEEWDGVKQDLLPPNPRYKL